MITSSLNIVWELALNHWQITNIAGRMLVRSESSVFVTSVPFSWRTLSTKQCNIFTVKENKLFKCVKKLFTLPTMLVMCHLISLFSSVSEVFCFFYYVAHYTLSNLFTSSPILCISFSSFLTHYVLLCFAYPLLFYPIQFYSVLSYPVILWHLLQVMKLWLYRRKI